MTATYKADRAAASREPFEFKEWIAGMHYRPERELPLWFQGLRPVSALYGMGVRARLAGYERGWLASVTADVPVISVGNLTTGGTGKTPIVIALANGLAHAGKRVMVLSRGYGAAEPIDFGRAGDPRHGDEACLIQEQAPEAVVIIGRNRVDALRRAVPTYQPDYVILDDGFQHLRLRRDVNILLFDGQALIGNGHLLPMGPLREPLSQIRRADVVMMTRTAPPAALETVTNWLRRFHPQPERVPVLPAPFETTGLRPVLQRESLPLEDFQGRAAILFSGLARPDSFERDVRQAGLNLLAHQRFSDHHVYTEADVAALLALKERYAADNPILLTTEKDWPKIRTVFPPHQEDALSAFYTLQNQPSLDGRWFYEEFLSHLTRESAEKRASRAGCSSHGH